MNNNGDSKSQRGGRRQGAGRPRSEESKLVSFRASGGILRHIEQQPNRSHYIKQCVALDMSMKDEGLQQLGTVWRASEVKDLTLPYFDMGIVAGFPIPLDNDERAQSIELMRMLCPNAEASYLIRVEGNSMIDAGIHSGDIVIVDKSNRNPSEHEVAVCEFNGEYTLKRFVKRNGVGYLVPANPEFPEIKVTEDDTFSIWGTVTYVLHHPHS